MEFPRRLLAAAGIAVALLTPTGANAEDWQPLTPEELQLTSEAKAPRAPAIYLYHRVDRDDTISEEDVYLRLKVLTEEGRKYGDVEIPFDRLRESISSVAARTISPDGRITKFEGAIFEKTLIKAQGVKVLAKVFTLPDVQVGTIVEYRYRRRMDSRFVFDSHWELNDELFTKHGVYTLLPNGYFALAWSWPNGLPEGSTRPERKSGRIQLETHDVPAFVVEDHMPPERVLKQRVDFVYSEDSYPKDPKSFWLRVGKERWRRSDSFLNARRAMDRAVTQIVDAGDSAEAKVRKIYARVQTLRNLSYDGPATDQEAKRENFRTNSDVGDVWEHGYGNDDELVRLFIALVRAAGVPAEEVQLGSRARDFFRVEMMNAAQLETNIAHVRLDGADLYLDPAVPTTPFGLLPWDESGITGLELGKDGGHFVTTPIPDADLSRIQRKGSFNLADDGELTGRVSVTYSGLEALTLRLAERREDAPARKRDLEDALKEVIATGAHVTLTNAPDWAASSPTVVVEYDVRVPAFAMAAGSRRLLPLAAFGAASHQAFTHGSRVHPMYFAYPYRQDDDLTIKLPATLHADTLVEPKTIDLGALTYRLAIERADADLHVTRSLAVKGTLIPLKFYDSVHAFFQNVRSADEQQIVLARPAKAGAR